MPVLLLGLTTCFDSLDMISIGLSHSAADWGRLIWLSGGTYPHGGQGLTMMFHVHVQPGLSCFMLCLICCTSTQARAHARTHTHTRTHTALLSPPLTPCLSFGLSYAEVPAVGQRPKMLPRSTSEHQNRSRGAMAIAMSSWKSSFAA